MAKITFTDDNGSITEFVDQASVDAAVAAAIAAQPVVHASLTEVDVKESDGTVDTFVPETPSEASSDAPVAPSDAAPETPVAA